MIQPKAMHEFNVSSCYTRPDRERIVENIHRAPNEQDAVSRHINETIEKGEQLVKVVVSSTLKRKFEMSKLYLNQLCGYQYEVPCRIGGILCDEMGKPKRFQPNYQYHIPYRIGSLFFDENNEDSYSFYPSELYNSNFEACMDRITEKFKPKQTEVISSMWNRRRLRNQLR